MSDTTLKLAVGQLWRDNIYNIQCEIVGLNRGLVWYNRTGEPLATYNAIADFISEHHLTVPAPPSREAELAAEVARLTSMAAGATTFYVGDSADGHGISIAMRSDGLWIVRQDTTIPGNMTYWDWHGEFRWGSSHVMSPSVIALPRDEAFALALTLCKEQS